MRTRGPSTLRLVAPLIASAVVFSTAGCSLIEDDDDATATPTTIVAPKVVETAQLEAILPQPADFGPEFVLGESEIWGGDDEEPEEPDDEFDRAIEDAIRNDCPAMESSEGPPGLEFEADHEAALSVAAPDGRAYEILLASSDELVMGPADRLELEEMLSEIALCPTSQIEDAENGMKMNVTFDGKAVDSLGEWGGEFSITMAMTHPNLPQPLVLRVSYLFFGVGSVAVALFAADGADDATMTVAAADLGRRDVVAANLAMMVAALQMEAPAEPATPTEPAVGVEPASETQPAAP